MDSCGRRCRSGLVTSDYVGFMFRAELICLVRSFRRPFVRHHEVFITKSLLHFLAFVEVSL